MVREFLALTHRASPRNAAELSQYVEVDLPLQ
jgi:hypothetical protein